MRDIESIPLDEVDFRPDPYLSVRCGVCGIEWAEHHPHEFVFVVRSRPTRDGRWFDRVGTCARFRPSGSPGPVDGATIANIPGLARKGRGSMLRYPNDVCPPKHLRTHGSDVR